MEDVRRLPIGEHDEAAISLDELAREGARRMIAAALRVEADEYVERFAGERTRMVGAWWSATDARGSGG